MKNIILTVLLVIGCSVTAQQKTKEERQAILDAKKAGITLIDSTQIVPNYKYHKLIEVTKEGILNSEQVIAFDSLSAKEIYSRINGFIQKKYVNPDSVQKGNIENEFIGFKGLKENCIVRKIMLSNFYYSLEYYFHIDIKDNKIRLTLVKAEARNLKEVESPMNPINYFIASSYNLFKNDGTPREMTKVFITGFNKNINEIVNDLVVNIRGKKSDW